MQGFKKHITLFLLVGFLVPQVVGSLHYLVVPHEFNSKSTTTFNKAELNLYHSCQYHLSTFSSVLPTENEFNKIDFVPLQATSNFCSLEGYVLQEDFNFQLRGPPPVEVSGIDQLAIKAHKF